MVAPRVYHGEYTLQETVILTQLNLNMQARDLERMLYGMVWYRVLAWNVGLCRGQKSETYNHLPRQLVPCRDMLRQPEIFEAPMSLTNE